MTRLETDRLVLRAFRPDDAEPYIRMCADPEMTRYTTPDGKPLSREDAWRTLAMFAGHWALRGYGNWAVEDKSSGELIGRLGLHFPEGWPGVEVGWFIDRSRWGRGYATEGGRAALRYAFETVGLDHVISVIHPDNVRSIAVAQRLGMRFERSGEVRGVAVSIYGIVRP